MVSICNRILVVLVLMVVFPFAGVEAAELKPVLYQLASEIVAKVPGKNSNRLLTIRIVNRETELSDQTATLLARKLELAVRQHLLKNLKFTEPASAYHIQINGTYRLTLHRLDLKLEINNTHSQTNEGETFVKRVTADYAGADKKRSVVVLDLETDLLNESLKDRFSNALRMSIKKKEIFQLESDRIRPNTRNCNTVACLSALGRKLGLEYVLQPKLDQLQRSLYLLTAQFIETKRAKLVSSVSIKHAGSLAFLEGSLDDLVYRIYLQEQMLKAAEEELARDQGHLSLTSDPDGADVYLDNEHLPSLTNLLLENVPSGRHTLTFRLASIAKTRELNLQAGEIKAVHVLLKRFTVESLLLLNNPENPFLPTFKFVFSKPIDPDSIRGSSVYLKIKNSRLDGNTTVSENILMFTPRTELQAAVIYTITATQDITSTDGDTLDLFFERHYRQAP